MNDPSARPIETGSDLARATRRRRYLAGGLAVVTTLAVLHVATGLTGETECQVDGTCSFGFPFSFHVSRSWVGTSTSRVAFFADLVFAALPGAAAFGLVHRRHARRVPAIVLVLVLVALSSLASDEGRRHALWSWNRAAPEVYGALFSGG